MTRRRKRRKSLSKQFKVNKHPKKRKEKRSLRTKESLRLKRLLRIKSWRTKTSNGQKRRGVRLWIKSESKTTMLTCRATKIKLMIVRMRMTKAENSSLMEVMMKKVANMEARTNRNEFYRI